MKAQRYTYELTHKEHAGVAAKKRMTEAAATKANAALQGTNEVWVRVVRDLKTVKKLAEDPAHMEPEIQQTQATYLTKDTEKYWAELWRENWNAMFDRLPKTKQAQILAAPDGFFRESH